jgi:hypothetical protein
MSAYGFSTFFAGIIGLITTFSIPGDQLVLAGASGALVGSGAVVLILGALLFEK